MNKLGLYDRYNGIEKALAHDGYTISTSLKLEKQISKPLYIFLSIITLSAYHFYYQVKHDPKRIWTAIKNDVEQAVNQYSKDYLKEKSGFKESESQRHLRIEQAKGALNILKKVVEELKNKDGEEFFNFPLCVQSIDRKEKGLNEAGEIIMMLYGQHLKNKDAKDTLNLTIDNYLETAKLLTDEEIFSQHEKKYVDLTFQRINSILRMHFRPLSHEMMDDLDQLQSRFFTVIS